MPKIVLQFHPEESSYNADFSKEIRSSNIAFTIAVCKELYFEACIYSQLICLRILRISLPAFSKNNSYKKGTPKLGSKINLEKLK